MNKTAYVFDIFVRAFFIFVALQLLLRNFAFSLFLAVGINLIYELTVGRKFWQAWKKAPKKPHRNWRCILVDLWHRAFSRERTKGFVMAGIVLLFMSYFVRLNTYYIIVACVVFIMAAITRFAPPLKSVTIPHESSHNKSVRTPTCPPVTAE